MKYQKPPTTSKLTLLRQICNYIPPHLVPKLARETGVEEKTRTFDEWSHTVSLCHAQLSHSIGLNDVCDALQLNSGPLSAIRGATHPTRNSLSHANKVRGTAMAERLFWEVFGYLGELSPRFCPLWDATINDLHPELEMPLPLGFGKLVCLRTQLLGRF
jgi:hypothetical protein